MSHFFLKRPVFASVFSILLVLAGLVAYQVLPIEQYPEITPPSVSVTAFYPGASADVLARNVAQPLEEQINGVDNMIYMSSVSASNGQLTINVVFETGTDIDEAAVNVTNRTKVAEPRLPAEVRTQGIKVEKRSSNFILIISLRATENSLSPVELSNYASLNVVEDLKRVSGVGGAMIFGARDYSMRIWMQPEKMVKYGLTAADISYALQQQNAQYATGQLGQPPVKGEVPLTYTIRTKGRLTTSSEFENIILRSNADGSALRLKDVARIELGSQDYSTSARLDGQPSTTIAVYPQSGANVIDVADNVYAAMDDIASRFPDGVSYLIPYDTTKFVRISIEEVITTLFEAFLLVFLVVFLFLQNLRATIIPLIAVPISIIGTMAGLFVLGYSINTLSLFAMVLAIGIVVDDAIVVLENVERLIHEKKMKALDAAFEAMREVQGALIAIVLVLCAVFVPVAFLGGLTGQLYKQFAVTISISVVLSGFVALTLTPVLCALFLKSELKPIRWLNWFNTFFEKLTHSYLKMIRFLLRNGWLAGALFIVLLGGIYILSTLVPKSLLPPEDQGFLISAVFLPDGASLQRTDTMIDKMLAVTSESPEVDHAVSVAGLDVLSFGVKSNAAAVWLPLKSWDERKAPGSDAMSLAARLSGQFMMIPDGLAFAFNPPPIMGLGTTGGFELYLQGRGDIEMQDLLAQAQKLAAAAASNPAFAFEQITASDRSPQLFATVNREKVSALNVDISQVYQTLQIMLGGSYINDFSKDGRIYSVYLQADSEYRRSLETINQIYVRSHDGAMIPINTLVSFEPTTGAEIMERYNGLPAIKISGNAKQGYSSGDALNAVEALADQILDSQYTIAWTGTAYQEKRSGHQTLLAFVLAIVIVFLILAAQYEKWLLPVSILLAVPFALFGALLAVYFMMKMPGYQLLANDIYFQIGLITLVGLSAKNAILIVEFAQQRRDAGFDTFNAVIEATRLRFRPIVMTSLAFTFGVLPLVLSTGAGANARHALGVGVVGGMLSATFLAVLFIPVFYFWLTDFRLSASKKLYPEYSSNNLDLH